MGKYSTLTDLIPDFENELDLSSESMQSPSIDQAVITSADLSDTVDIQHCRAFILNAESTLHYLNAKGNEITYTFPAGEYVIPIRRIFATGTVLSDNVMLTLI